MPYAAISIFREQAGYIETKRTPGVRTGNSHIRYQRCPILELKFC